jgi:hypothetical protein
LKKSKNIWLFCRTNLLFLLLIFTQVIAYSQDSLKQKKLVFNGYVKDMQTEIFQNIKGNWTSANLIHNRLNCKWLISSAFTASVELRNRFLYGSILSEFPGYDKTFETDNGITTLSKNIFNEKSFLLNTAIDRAWFQYSSDKFQLTAGRQRINWGQTFVWNPNDLFNSYSYFDFDYEEKPGSDAVRMQYYSSPTSVFEIAAKETKQKKATIAGLYRFNKWNYDFQFIGGIADQTDFVLGTGWSGQLLDGGFRGEATYFYPEKNFSDTTGIFIASVGYDYTFKNSLFLQVEALYNGNKDSINMFSLDQLNTNNTSSKNLFLPDYSVFSALSYPVTPLVSTSLAGIVSTSNKLFFIIPTISISLKENMELSFTAQLLRYYENKGSNQNLNFIYARLKCSF